MPRKSNIIKKSLPPLFKRGKKRIYSFRFLNSLGKDKWISTETSDLKKAKLIQYTFFEKDVAAKASLNIEKTPDKIAGKLTKAIYEDITGKKESSIKIADIHENWIELNSDYKDLSKSSKDYCKTIFKMFSTWCNSENISNADGVTPEGAKRYSNKLWDSGISRKTYNDHIRHLSRVFNEINNQHLPYGNPFLKIKPKSRIEFKAIGHKALEPEQMKQVLAEAALHGRDFRDLLVLGSQTGMRLKDAALLKWSAIDGDFIQIVPHKTKKKENKSRIPITKAVRRILSEREKFKNESKFVFPELASKYSSVPGSISAKAKLIFENALGAANTVVESGEHRMNAVSVYSFHSFRTTYMSLLAKRNVSIRDAMRIMGWHSMEMILVYERELEKAKVDADKRTMRLVNEIEEFNIEIPEVSHEEPVLKPTKKNLESLVQKYSNVTISKLYGMSSVAIKKWMIKFGIVRAKRIESADVDEREIEKIRKELRA